MTGPERAQRFRDLHYTGRPLVLPNVWDAGSARVFESSGALAIATTSAGVAWSLGTRDGNVLHRDDAIALIARVVEAVDAPVTADIETGYAADPEGVAETVELVLRAGAVGVNLEDADHNGPGPLLDITSQVERLRAARAATASTGIPLFLNARVDTYLAQVGEAETRLAETITRAKAYVAAGADGIFVPGVHDAGIIKALCSAIEVPLNVMAGPGAPTVAQLAELGVARVSVGPWIAARAYLVAREAAQELLSRGTYEALHGAMNFGELNQIMGK